MEGWKETLLEDTSGFNFQTMQGLIYKSNTDHPWHLIEELPEEPKNCAGCAGDRKCHSCKMEHEEYKRDLDLAISNAVRVENQEAAKQVLSEQSDVWLAEPDKVYPVEISYKIRVDCTAKCDGECGTCNSMNKLARLLPCKEEVRDLWTEIEEKVKQSQWFALDVVRYLKENYNITRKQQ